MSDNIRIAKNSLFLYLRMFVTMAVTLYTSRIVLNSLGVNDFGIYSIVGGVVSLFSFFNAAMTSATQRYLSFDIGQNNFEKINKTFNVTIIIHILIAIIILFFAETVGLWFVNNKLNIDYNRLNAANWVFQFSIFTTIIGVLQVPFNSLIIAKERMNVFAFMSMLDVILKFLIVYFLAFSKLDKLILYSGLVFAVTLIIAICYRIYCGKYFNESKFRFFNDKDYYKELLAYSGWNLFGNLAAVAKGQGINLLLNFFYGTIINAAYGITLQVQNAVNVFVNNFQIAVNPQIIKSYSINNIEKANFLINQSSRFSLLLILLIIGPLLYNTNFVLLFWLKNPPNYTEIFVQLCLFNVLIDCVSGPLMTGAQATGKIKWYQIIVGTLVFLNFPISFLALRLFNEPYVVFTVSILISIISLQFRLFFLMRIMNFNSKTFYKDVLGRGTIILSILFVFFYFMKTNVSTASNLVTFFGHSLVILVFIVFLIIFIGLKSNERTKLFSFINKFLKKNGK